MKKIIFVLLFLVISVDSGEVKDRNVANSNLYTIDKEKIQMEFNEKKLRIFIVFEFSREVFEVKVNHVYFYLLDEKGEIMETYRHTCFDVYSDHGIYFDRTIELKKGSKPSRATIKLDCEILTLNRGLVKIGP